MEQTDDTRKLGNLLEWAFTWSTSAQGHVYWASVADALGSEDGWSSVYGNDPELLAGDVSLMIDSHWNEHLLGSDEPLELGSRWHEFVEHYNQMSRPDDPLFAYICEQIDIVIEEAERIENEHGE